MPTIKLIRAAIRDIQKLPLQAFKRVNTILNRLSQGDERNTKSLEGADHLLRTAENDVRVIWEWGKNRDDIFIIKAGLRKNVFQGQDAFIKRQRVPAYIWQQQSRESSVDSISVDELERQEDRDWYRFIYGEFRYSPVLTEHQREISNKLLQSVTNPTADIRSRTLLVQSAPGTGKTVCAALLGCEFHRHYGWNTMLLVPEILCKDVAEYWEVKKILRENKQGFFLGTYQGWVKEILPKLYQCLASPDEELQALQNISKRIHLRTEEAISYQDVLLYQTFVLSQNNVSFEQSPIYQANKKRIEFLQKNIKREWWEEELKQKNRLCRVDAANELLLNPPPPPQAGGRTILIIDEAQNYLLTEIRTIINLCETWYGQNHITYLWLLGDLNQRVQPVDFIWGNLELKKTLELRHNYRNSRQILEFANQFLDFARELNLQNGGNHKQIPQPANPEYAYENGEPVVLLKYASKSGALEFLKRLAQAAKIENDDGRSLLQELANQVRILYCNLPIDKKDKIFDGLEFLNAEQAQGREFEASVAFCIFEGSKPPSLDESFQWYTLLTRTRSRLLIVATEQEINRVGRGFFTQCTCFESETEVIQWMTELASENDLTRNQEIVQQRLLASCENKPLRLYWDTYAALALAKVEDECLYAWEQEAINLLKKHSIEELNSELNQAIDISLRCLILRSMDLSWQAVTEALRLQNEQPERERLIESIARDLENKALPYEAARVRTRIEIPFPSDYPFRDLAQESGSLVTILYNSISSNLF